MRLPSPATYLNNDLESGVIFTSILTILSLLRVLLYMNFYYRRNDEGELWHFSKKFAVCEIALDLCVVGLNLTELHLGHSLLPAEEILYKANLFAIGPAVLCCIWTWTLLRPDDYEPIEGDCHAYCEHQNLGDFPLDTLPTPAIEETDN